MKTIIETPRLILREIDIERDLQPWADMMSDEDTVRYIGGQTMNKAQTWRTMAMMIGHQQGSVLITSSQNGTKYAKIC